MAITGTTTSIEDALLWHLSVLVLAPVVPVAWPDIPFTPVVGTPYLEPTVLPNKTDFAGVGVGSPHRHFGLLQVNVHGPQGQGSAPTSEIADQIMEHFAPDTVIARNGVRVRIGAFDGGTAVPYRSQGFNGNGFRVIPVTIPYWCDIF